MKITPEDYDRMKEAVLPIMRKTLQDLKLSERRRRWDAMWASGFDTRSMYEYLNDNHIDTALRRIAKEACLECA